MTMALHGGQKRVAIEPPLRLPTTRAPPIFQEPCSDDKHDGHSSDDDFDVDEPPTPPTRPEAGAFDQAQTPQRDATLAEEASRRLKLATLAPRLTPSAYKHLSRPLVNWIRLTTCVRAQDLCHSAATPPGEVSSDTYDGRQIPRLNWWRLPRQMREAARLGIKFFFDRLPRGRRLRNYPMREAHQGACTEFARLISIGAVGGPFSDNSSEVTTVHPMGAVLKKATGGKPPKTRLVIDATASELNEALTPVPFALPSVSDGVALVQANTRLAKLDLADGFFHCSVHPDDRHHIGLRAPAGTVVSPAAAARWGDAWRHRIRQDGSGDASNLLFRGNVALFGIKSSPFHFCKLTEMLQWIIRSMGGKTLAFVDDLILASVAHRDDAGRRCDRVAARSCEAWVVALRTLFNFFGFNEAVHKYEGPSRECEWLGLTLSSMTGRVTIPAGKATKLLALIHDFERRFRKPTPGATAGTSDARPTRHELQSLIGKLSFVSAAVQGGRCYLRRMYDTLPADVRAPIVLDDAFWLDLAFWPPAIRADTGATMPQHFPRPAIATISDASEEAGGFTVVHSYGRERHTVAWGEGENLHSSNWRELATIVRMLVKYADAWTGRRVVHATDNTTAVAAINHGTIRSTRGADDLMPLVREARACVAKHDIDFQAWHMAGTTMVAEGTDGLSRPRRGATPNFFLRDDVTEFVCAFHGLDRAEVAHDVADIRDCPTRMAGRNIFLAMPFSHIDEAFTIMSAAKGENPAFTGCSILAPDWPSPPWASKLRHFRRALTFPAGSKLFSRHAGGRPSPSSTPMVLWHMPRSMSPPPSRRFHYLSLKLVNFLSSNASSSHSSSFPDLIQARRLAAVRDAARSAGTTTTLSARNASVMTGLWPSTSRACKLPPSSSPPTAWGSRPPSRKAAFSASTSCATSVTSLASATGAPQLPTPTSTSLRSLPRRSSTASAAGWPTALACSMFATGVDSRCSPTLSSATRGSPPSSTPTQTLSGFRSSTSTSPAPDSTGRGARTPDSHPHPSRESAPPSRSSAPPVALPRPSPPVSPKTSSKASHVAAATSASSRPPSRSLSSSRSRRDCGARSTAQAGSHTLRPPHWPHSCWSSSASSGATTPPRSCGTKSSSSTAAAAAPSLWLGAATATCASTSRGTRPTRTDSQPRPTPSAPGSSSPCALVAASGSTASSMHTASARSAPYPLESTTAGSASLSQCPPPPPSIAPPQSGGSLALARSSSSGSGTYLRPRPTGTYCFETRTWIGSRVTPRSTEGTRRREGLPPTTAPPLWPMDGPRAETARAGGGPPGTCPTITTAFKTPATAGPGASM